MALAIVSDRLLQNLTSGPEPRSVSKPVFGLGGGRVRTWPLLAEAQPGDEVGTSKMCALHAFFQDILSNAFYMKLYNH